MRMVGLATIVACLQLAAGIAFADDQVVARIAKGVAITVTDLAVEAERYSPDTVKGTFARPENVRQIARNLLLRRALALEAEEEGLDKRFEMAVRLRLAKEKVLSDARVQQFDGAPPDTQTLEKLALAEYNASTQSFAITEAVTLDHILVGKYRKDAQQLAVDLLGQIKAKKANFGTLAIMYSDDAASKHKHGDMGPIDKGKFRPEFERAIAGLEKVGDVSEIFETELGWHIVRLSERRAAGRKPFDEVKAELMQTAARNVVDKRRALHLEPLESGIEVDERVVETIVARYR
jgi:peptidyl-prolyl cis-trans isomerase C